ncbi:unnamed protein product [Polarella glacialis]|uniref:Uncharacterized protein n=1 Tax=Polarella glacialis TaxID=89957 RepID=A0A813HC90_POLGL|nr:unnamed protein product [Polarella glacialis]
MQQRRPTTVIVVVVLVFVVVVVVAAVIVDVVAVNSDGGSGEGSSSFGGCLGNVRFEYGECLARVFIFCVRCKKHQNNLGRSRGPAPKVFP